MTGRPDPFELIEAKFGEQFQQPPAQALHGLADKEDDKPSILSRVVEGAVFGSEYRLNDSDRAQLKEIEFAGRGLAWAVLWNGRERTRVGQYDGSTNSFGTFAVEEPTLFLGTNLNLLSDGTVAVGTPQKLQVGNFVLLPAFKSQPEVIERASIIPINGMGLPNGIPVGTEQIADTAGGRGGVNLIPLG